jgi:hypothetical protein
MRRPALLLPKQSWKITSFLPRMQQMRWSSSSCRLAPNQRRQLVLPLRAHSLMPAFFLRRMLLLVPSFVPLPS